MAFVYDAHHDGRTGSLKLYRHVEASISGYGWLFTPLKKYGGDKIGDPSTSHRTPNDALSAAKLCGVKPLGLRP